MAKPLRGKFIDFISPGNALRVYNLPEGASESELWQLFEEVAARAVLRVDVRGKFALVHVRDREAALSAQYALHRRLHRGKRLDVRRCHTDKIYVSHFLKQCTAGDLRALFQEFGPVAECDIFKGCAIIRMEKDEDAAVAVERLHGRDVKGKRILVGFCHIDSRRSCNKGEKKKERSQDCSDQPSASQGTSYRHPPAAPLKMAYRPQPTTGQAAMYRAQPSALLGNGYRAQSSVPLGTSGAQPAASVLTSCSVQAAAYEALLAAPKALPYEAQPTTTYAATYTASYGVEPVLPASNVVQPVSSKTAVHGAHPPEVGHAAACRDQASSALSAANQAAAFRTWDADATSYGAEVSASLSTADREAAEATCAVQWSVSFPLAAGCRAQPAYSGLTRTAQLAASNSGTSLSKAAALPPPYERVHLSPPHGSCEDLYRRTDAINNRDMAKPEAAAPLLPYERVRLSPPRSSYKNFYRKTDAVNKSHAAKAEIAGLPPPYERIRLSPPRGSC